MSGWPQKRRKLIPTGTHNASCIRVAEVGIKPVTDPGLGRYDAMVLAVAHRQFHELGAKGIRVFGKENSVLYDVKHVLAASEVDGRL